MPCATPPLPAGDAILIVVEHAFRVKEIIKMFQPLCDTVLILIVVEHALGVLEQKSFQVSMGLNPYCNGICSR